jgi:hypothetical protein
VRLRVAAIGLVVTVVGACTVDTPEPPRLSYAPPSMEPPNPGWASADQPADLIWNLLLDRLTQSSLQVNLADSKRDIIVARYSGDPEPYVTCGSILVDHGGDLEQVPASGKSSFRRVVDGRRLEVTRGLQLDARLVVEVEPDGSGAIVETTSNYVLTKTVVAEDRSARTHRRAQEVISFSTGERGRFVKGTVCQSTGVLERTVLDVLPRVTQAQRVGRGEPASTSPLARTSGPEKTTSTSNLGAPPPGRRRAEGSGPAPVGSQKMIAQAEIPLPEVPEVNGQGTPFECQIDDQIFCEFLDVTDLYRRANQEGNLGLALDVLEDDNPLLDGSGLGLDISLPNYESYLTVSYFVKDGTVRHVLSGSYQRWPANAREFIRDVGVSVADRQSIEMVIALASDIPVFSYPRPHSETAELYLSELSERLDELSNADSPRQIAASLKVVTPTQRAGRPEQYSE